MGERACYGRSPRALLFGSALCLILTATLGRSEEPSGPPRSSSDSRAKIQPRDSPPADANASGDGSPNTSNATDRNLPITLHLDDVDVRKVLEMLSRNGPVNLMVSPAVTGRITANLQGLSFEQALAAILKLCNLVARSEDGLIYIYTADEQLRSAAPKSKVVTRVYHLNFIKSADLEKMITPFLTEKAKISVSPASEVGIEPDNTKAGGNSLAGGETVVIQDEESVLRTIDEVLRQLDMQPVQVLIEAVLLSVSLERGKELGVNFALLDGAGSVLTVLGNGAEINASVGFNPSQVLTAEGKLTGTSAAGFSASPHGLRFGFVDKGVTGFIRALERFGKTEVLASPRLLVLNKQRAEIQLGERLGYRVLQQTQTSTLEQIEFLNVGTQLRLRPFVSTDGMIRMEIHPERSSGKVVNNIPQTATSEVTTNVMVPDGSTIVIGGLIDTVDDSQQDGIPGLSRLRWIGHAFRDKRKSSTKKELIVLLTPRIWDPRKSTPPGRYRPSTNSDSDGRIILPTELQ